MDASCRHLSEETVYYPGLLTHKVLAFGKYIASVHHNTTPLEKPLLKIWSFEDKELLYEFKLEGWPTDAIVTDYGDIVMTMLQGGL